MKSKTLWWTVRIVAVLVLGAGTSALAQAPTPMHFSGIINDYTPAHDTKGDLTGPWEMHGTWSLELNRQIRFGRLFRSHDHGAVGFRDGGPLQALLRAVPCRRSRDTQCSYSPHHNEECHAQLQYERLPCRTFRQPCYHRPFRDHRLRGHYWQWESGALFEGWDSAVPAAGLRHRRDGCPVFERDHGVRCSCDRAFRHTSDPRRGSRAKEVRSRRSSRRALG